MLNRGAAPRCACQAKVAARHAARFPRLGLVSIVDFGGWAKAQATHFVAGGVFDQIYTPSS